ncbi:hypothetical protein CO116_00595 [Candidatus Falkowbacteria bacterium CG_4_9_14_3_um_filter_38_19]|uniref:Uncharacterized protein n=2 Tax=Candidatus Falkowiibacteriota TaxID=1752728 RepID=A0A2M6WQJ4_9BACT|nr:hypothetical protein [Candidatus Parcubacteria bacterium]PIT95042.1 MAG: hypothetical protein COT96_02100 [Candidatus Falkowbacteria bacterium CG10_big_fil_rev_8_21_14_0_10_38_22]PJB17678.1 MAG: hypothetical protein CO116_00595 [Candidatus Falkowbacteria bacterium CG_4_9_14_3_um_filter_38_19]
MAQTTQVKIKSGATKIPAKIVEAIFEELRLLRNEVRLLLPQEELEEYTHPDRIKHSYRKAIKKYPPVSLLYRPFAK